MRSRLRLCAVPLLACLLGGPAAPVVADGTTARPAPTRAVTADVASRAGGETFLSRVATLNLPGGQFHQQKKLIDQPRRTRAALHKLQREDISIVALQELSTPSRKVLWKSRRWGVISAPANSIRGRSEIGNGVAYQTRKWVRVKADHVHLQVASRPRGLNMAVATLRRRGTGTHVVVMSIHHPIPSEVNAKRVRERAKKFEIRYAKRVRRQTGYPVVIAGDTNERDAQGTFRRAGFDLGVRHVGDLIVAKGVEMSHPRTFIDNVYLRFSDHALVTTLLRLPR